MTYIRHRPLSFARCEILASRISLFEISHLNWIEVSECVNLHIFFTILKKKHRLTSAAHFSLSGFFSYFFSLNAQLFNLHKSRWNSNWTSARYYTEENNVLWLEHICSCIYHLTNKFSNLLSLRLRAIISKCLIQVPRTWTNKKKKKKKKNYRSWAGKYCILTNDDRSIDRAERL